MPRSEDDELNAAFAELKDAFTAVARKHTGAVRDLLLEAAGNMAPGPGDDADAIEDMSETYEDLIDRLEDRAVTDPAAARAMDEIGAAVHKTMWRLIR